MLAATGVFFLALGVLSFFVRLRLGRYRRYPVELFVFAGTALALGLLAAIRNPGAFTLTLLGLEVAAVGGVVRFFLMGARFPSDEVAVRTGERFPDFTLPDSEGGTFSSRSLLGNSPALYISYRGHF